MKFWKWPISHILGILRICFKNPQVPRIPIFQCLSSCTILENLKSKGFGEKFKNMILGAKMTQYSNFIQEFSLKIQNCHFYPLFIVSSGKNWENLMNRFREKFIENSVDFGSSNALFTPILDIRIFHKKGFCYFFTTLLLCNEPILRQRR